MSTEIRSRKLLNKYHGILNGGCCVNAGENDTAKVIEMP